MDLREPEVFCTTKTEEGTEPSQKKRFRRVSFAESTSVHFFDRDEDCETPPSDILPLQRLEIAVLGFGKDSVNIENSKVRLSQDEVEGDDEDGSDDNDGSRGEEFLRPRLSPSPGSPISSATPNDEDNFFGPVSASFIRLGKISDSAASDENHNITMDSRTFSMHFRSLERSESSGEARTPMEVHLPFGETTPTENKTSSIAGSSMVLTGLKKPSSLSPVDKAKNGGDSNDMSLVGENPRRYDFGRISPDLDAIMTGGNKDALPVSIKDEITASKQSDEQKKDSVLEKNYSRDCSHIGPADNSNNDKSVKLSSAVDTSLGEPKSDSVATSIDRDACPSREMDAFATNAPVDQTRSPPKMDASFGESQHSLNNKLERSSLKMFSSINKEPFKDNMVLKSSSKTWFESGNLCSTEGLIGQNSLEIGRHVSNVDKKSSENDVSALAGSISSLSAKRQITFSDTGVSSGYPLMAASLEQQSSSAGKKRKSDGVAGSSVNNTISEFTIPMVSPGASPLKDGTIAKYRSLDLKLRTPAKIAFEGNHTDDKSSHLASVLLPFSGGHPSTVVQNAVKLGTTVSIGDDSSVMPKLSDLVKTKESVDLLNDIEPLLPGPDHIKTEKAGISPHRFASSPVKAVLSVPQGFHGSPLRDLQQHDDKHVKLINFASEQYGNSVEDVPSATKAIVNKFDFSPSMGMNNRKVISQTERMDGHAISTVDLQDELAPSENLQNPPRNSNDLSSQLGNPTKDLLIGTDPVRFAKNPSRNGCSSGSNDYNHLVERLPSSTSTQHGNKFRTDSLCQKVGILKTEVRMQAFEASLRRNGSAEETINMDEMKQNAMTWTSLEIHKGSCHDLEFPLQSDNKLRNLNDIFSRISGDTSQILSPLTDKLNLQVISLLEDIVSHLHQIKIYGLLCREHRPQKLTDPVTDLTQGRIAEIRLALYGMAYKRAKLQLLCLKQEWLMKRVNLLSSGVEKSWTFSLMFSNHLSVLGKAGAQALDNNQLQCDEVTVMKQKVEAAGKKMKSLLKLFQTSCEMKEEQYCVDSIAFVYGYMKKRMCCGLIRQNLLSWKLDNLESNNGQHSIVLSYHGLLSQRLTLKDVHLLMMNNWCNTPVLMKFPNLDPLTACPFLLNAEANQKYAGAKNMAKVTQVTSSLLSNLLDVVEEVQLAQIELRNLIRASFHSPTAEKLHLDLCFVDYKDGRKAVVRVDASCLNRGVYPWGVLPWEVRVWVGGSEEAAAPQSVCGEIRAALGRLSPGYGWIIRLCRRVSEVVKA